MYLLSYMRKNLFPVLGFPTRSTRLLAATAFLFAAAGEAAGALSCPHHDALPGQVEAAAVETHAGAPLHGPRHSGADHGGRDNHSGPCTCLGNCHDVGLAHTLSASPAIEWDLPTGRVQILHGVEEAPAPAAPYLLPFANAPPASL